MQRCPGTYSRAACCFCCSRSRNDGGRSMECSSSLRSSIDCGAVGASRPEAPARISVSVWHRLQAQAVFPHLSVSRGGEDMGVTNLGLAQAHPGISAPNPYKNSGIHTHTVCTHACSHVQTYAHKHATIAHLTLALQLMLHHLLVFWNKCRSCRGRERCELWLRPRVACHEGAALSVPHRGWRVDLHWCANCSIALTWRGRCLELFLHFCNFFLLPCK